VTRRMRPLNFLPRRFSLPIEVADCLRVRLAKGEWVRMMPGEMELARELQVGRNTIRAALAVLEKEGMIRATMGKRREVLAKVKKTRKPTAKVVILLLPAPWQTLPPATMLWMDSLRSRLQAAGWQMHFTVEASAFRRAPAAVLDSLVGRHPSAVWILYRSPAVMQRWFEKNEVSAVIAGSCQTGVSLPQVDTDYRAASRHAASRLLGLGHRRLAILTPAAPFAGDEESLRGFREAIEAVEGATLRVVPVRDAKTSVTQALRGLLAVGERPSAIFTLEARHTATALTYLAQQGVAIPGDMSLLSRDHDEFLAHLVPEPARYERQAEVFAKKLEHLVTTLGSGVPLKQRQHLIMPTFVRGETLGRPPVPRKNR
jgi:DNA-binding LacI/PurR family transcriptional regulator